jgi:ribonuclease-3
MARSFDDLHPFEDERLLELALTHASTGLPGDNERMEFLGDAVLDLIVAEELYARHADLAEGALTEAKAYVVSRRTLGEAALTWGLAERAALGTGLDRRALSRPVLANLYEAWLGAVYLDADLETARRVALETLEPFLAEATESRATKSPKQVLQEACQQEFGQPPTYELLVERGLDHAKAFLVRATTPERDFPSAWGRTRKEAEGWAAHEALLVLEAEAD